MCLSIWQIQHINSRHVPWNTSGNWGSDGRAKNISVYWDVTWCSLVETYWGCRDMRWPFVHDKSSVILKMGLHVSQSLILIIHTTWCHIYTDDYLPCRLIYHILLSFQKHSSWRQTYEWSRWRTLLLSNCDRSAGVPSIRWQVSGCSPLDAPTLLNFLNMLNASGALR